MMILRRCKKGNRKLHFFKFCRYWRLACPTDSCGGLAGHQPQALSAGEGAAMKDAAAPLHRKGARTSGDTCLEERFVQRNVTNSIPTATVTCIPATVKEASLLKTSPGVHRTLAE